MLENVATAWAALRAELIETCQGRDCDENCPECEGTGEVWMYVDFPREHVTELDAAMAKRKARVADDDLAERIAIDCHDAGHDARWCATCAARRDGIEAYREALKGENHA